MRRLVSGSLLSAALALGFGVASADQVEVPAYAHTLYGIVKEIKPTLLIVQRRDGRLLGVDIAVARQTHRAGVLYVNRAVALHGDYDAAHVFHAASITGAAGLKFSPAAWPLDE